MQPRCAMCAGPCRNAESLRQRIRHLSGVAIPDIQRNDRRMLCRSEIPVYPHPRDRRHTLIEPLGERILMRSDRGKSNRI